MRFLYNVLTNSNAPATGVDETISEVHINLLDKHCDEYYRVTELLEVLAGCIKRYSESTENNVALALKPGVVTELLRSISHPAIFACMPELGTQPNSRKQKELEGLVSNIFRQVSKLISS